MIKKTTKKASAGGASIAISIIVLLGFAGFITGYSILSDQFGSVLLGIIGGITGFIALPLSLLIFLGSMCFFGFLSISSISYIYEWSKNMDNNYISKSFRAFILYPIIFYVALCTVTLIFMVLPNLYLSMWLSEILSLSPLISSMIMGVNILIGFIGIGILDALENSYQY